MSFAPIIPASGLAGWEFLSRTRERQEESFARSPRIARMTDDFAASFNALRSADALVADRGTLRVVLGAFGLQDDLPNRAFIREVVGQGVADRGAIANRLSDSRYGALAASLSHLADGAGRPPPDGLAAQLVARFEASSFEVAVGRVDDAMRLSLAAARKLPEIAEGYRSETARWFAMLGDPPMREVIQTALGLPREFAGLDLDDQVARMQEASQRRFGTDSVRDLAAPEMVETITQRFLLMRQVQETQTALTGAATALTLLQGAGR